MNVLLSYLIFCGIPVLIALAILFLKYLFAKQMTKKLNKEILVDWYAWYLQSTIDWAHSERLKTYMKKSNGLILSFWACLIIAVLSFLKINFDS